MKKFAILFFIISSFSFCQKIDSGYLQKADRIFASADVAEKKLSTSFDELVKAMFRRDPSDITDNVLAVERDLREFNYLRYEAGALATIKKMQEVGDNPSLTFLVEYSTANSLEDFSRKPFGNIRNVRIYLKKAEKMTEILLKRQEKEQKEKAKKQQNPGRISRASLCKNCPRLVA